MCSSQKQANGKIPADGQVVKSIVTTNLVDAVAKNYGAELIEVLTGFKWIGKQVLKMSRKAKEPICLAWKRAMAA